jgi:glycosyltransferase involved in cell wall biosynthesis
VTTQRAISVIISTFNRGDGLRDTLRSVLANDPAECDYEVIAVDNNSTDNTAAVIQSLIAEGHTRLHYVFEAQQGVSYGRNAGIRTAKAPILAFTDDDVVVRPNWLSAIKRAFDENPGVDYVTGRMLPIYDEPPPRWLTQTNSGPCVLRERGDQPLYSEPGRFFPGWATANIAFRKRVFTTAGLFAPDFPRGQDLEFIIRVWRTQARGMYAPDVTVSHRITPERITKAYHRMWHSREGDIRARVHFREIFDRDDRVRNEPAPTPRLLGVPRFVLREIVLEAGRWLLAVVRRQGAAAFRHEALLRQSVSYARTSFRRRSLNRGPMVGLHAR